MNAQYNIEKAEYRNNVLLIGGWIFCGEDENKVDKAQISIEFAKGLKKSIEVSFFERRDVSDCFGLKYSNVGFCFSSVVKGFKSANVYLEYHISGHKERLHVLKMSGEHKSRKNEALIMSQPEIDGFCCLENFDEIRVADYKWKSIKHKQVDVIIPVYNGYQYFDKLFSTLFLTNLNMRVIVINDCSPDQRVDNYIETLCKEKNNIVYIKNEENLGFVKSVNRGLAIVRNDVALVNTDVELPEYWLERLMFPIFNDSKVASTTPYTNCGTLCSFPEMGKDNCIFENRSVFFVDSIFRDLQPSYTEIPTGVGFCMGMSYKAIKKVGVLDEANFGKGYCEENDWCQRAIEKGFKNVQIENLFVYHKHGGSFQSEEKKKLLNINIKKLEEKHPAYLQSVASYFESDVNKRYRDYALFMCLMQTEAVTTVFFNHVLGGGANDYMVSQRSKAIASGEKCIEVACNAYRGYYQISVSYKNYNVRIYSISMTKLVELLTLSKIKNIFINELVTYPDAENTLKIITDLRNLTKAQMIMLGHDYYAVCPTINLLNKDGNYCYLNCGKNNECLINNKYIADLQYTDIVKWRKMWGRFLEECDSIVVFSDDSRDIFQRAYGGRLENIEVVPHRTNRMLEVKKRYKFTDTFNVAVLGVLSDRKGLLIVKRMLEQIEREQLPISIIVVGTCEEDISGRHCIITGVYTREQLPSLMYLYDIDMIFIASVWPETFSFTTEEAMKMRMPVAAFNIGAPAERVRKYDKGIIIEKISAENAISKIVKYSDKNTLPKASKGSVLFIIEYKSFSSRYRVEHLREHLAYWGIASETLDIKDVDLENIGNYKIISIYRCSDVAFVKRITDIARKNSQKVLYDIDDFIFDYDKIAGLEFLKGEEYKNFKSYSEDICACMGLCDVLTTSTTTLAEQIRKRFPEKLVLECRNAACMEMQLLSEIAVDNYEKNSSDKVVLGYFSGSHTHNKDWLIIENVISDVMQSNPNVELLLVGVIEVGLSLSAFESRITRVSFVNWQRLPELLRSIDINLMPLENELFHWCKSENKWMEAGLVGVPTIASRNPELERVMTDGEDVLFCADESDWNNNITALINDINLRNDIGQKARTKVYNTHLTISEVNFEKIKDVIMK